MNVESTPGKAALQAMSRGLSWRSRRTRRSWCGLCWMVYYISKKRRVPRDLPQEDGRGDTIERPHWSGALSGLMIVPPGADILR